MGPFLDWLSKSAGIWIAHPVEFAGAILLGVIIGYLLSRLRHQGTIQAQQERLEHKDDVIKFKDEAIAATSSTKPQIEPPMDRQRTIVDAPPTPRSRMASEDPRFRDINAKIIAETEDAIRFALRDETYELVFNPKTGKSKLITFQDNGTIGQGRNGNENTWRISGGRLELLNDRAEVYSRFFLLPDKRSFHHTNDPDTRSIKGQYLTPITKPRKVLNLP
jgi:hypothetical protein